MTTKAKRMTVTISFLTGRAELREADRVYHLLIKRAPCSSPDWTYYMGARGNTPEHGSPESAAISLAVHQFRHGAYFSQESDLPYGYGSICKTGRTGARNALERVRITVQEGWV